MALFRRELIPLAQRVLQDFVVVIVRIPHAVELLEAQRAPRLVEEDGLALGVRDELLYELLVAEQFLHIRVPALVVRPRHPADLRTAEPREDERCRCTVELLRELLVSRRRPEVYEGVTDVAAFFFGAEVDGQVE